MLPVYDTAANDFNFATIYTENASAATTGWPTTTC